MRHWRIYNLFMTTCYMYKITIIIITYQKAIFRPFWLPYDLLIEGKSKV